LGVKINTKWVSVKNNIKKLLFYDIFRSILRGLLPELRRAPNRPSQTSKVLVNIHLSRQHTITFIVIFE